MTNLYETLGVKQDAPQSEIEETYRRLTKFFDTAKNADLDENMKVFFDDITLAYKTLSTAKSRAEYDEYIS